MTPAQGAERARLWGVLVTYRRPQALGAMLPALARQTRPPDRLLVVDNGGDGDAVRAAVAAAWLDRPVEVVETGENLGPAGGFALGIERVTRAARTGDWIVLLDDDDPPAFDDLLEELMDCAQTLVVADPTCGALGCSGTRLDRRTGRTHRVPDHELSGPVRVDALGGNHLPLLRVAATRQVGGYRRELFFGDEELEFFLRLQRAGWSVWSHGDLHRRHRRAQGRLGRGATRPSRALGDATWRRYYAVRNLVWVLRAEGARRAALRVSVAHVAKVLVNAAVRPRRTLAHAPLVTAALRDGWTGRLGRRGVPADPYGRAA